MSNVAELESLARRAFIRADKDGNGWLSHSELKKALRNDKTLNDAVHKAGGRPWAAFWAELDANHDGRIELDELIDYVRREAKRDQDAEDQNRASTSGGSSTAKSPLSYAAVAARPPEQAPAAHPKATVRPVTRDVAAPTSASAATSSGNPLQTVAVLALAGFLVYRVLRK